MEHQHEISIRFIYPPGETKADREYVNLVRGFSNPYYLNVNITHIIEGIHEILKTERDASEAIKYINNMIKYGTKLGMMDGHWDMSTREQLDTIQCIQQACQRFKVDEYFWRIIHNLYKNDILTEPEILEWEKEMDPNVPLDQCLLDSMKPFLDWLKTDEEEDDPPPPIDTNTPTKIT